MTPKDRWLAVNLSWILPGLGLLYAGRRRAGIAWILADMSVWALYATWLVVPEAEWPFVLAAFVAGSLFRVLASIASYRAAKALTPELARPKDTNPWFAVFLSGFIPGLGHIHARRWVRGILFLAGSLAWPFAIGRSIPEPWAPLAGFGLVAAVALDSFLVLRKKNLAPLRTTVASLVLILVLSRSYPLGKLLQLTVAEVYRTPSSSMEPTLLGPRSYAHEGCEFEGYHTCTAPDRILAARSAYWFSPVRRFDVVVFEFPLNRSMRIAKRVAGMPGEELVIRRGDLYARPKGESRFRICRKPAETQEAVWIDPDAGRPLLEGASEFERRWTAEGSFSVGKVELDVKAPGARFVRSDVQETGDLRIAFDVELAAAGEVFAEVGPFELRLGSDGGKLRRRAGREVALAGARIEPGRRVRVELAVWDGLAVARVDGRTVGEIAWIEFREDAFEAEGTLAFGARGTAFRVRDLRVGRDLQYRGKEPFPDDTPIAIPEGHYFVLGDNVSSSHDSRSWTVEEFTLKDGRKVRCERQEVHHYDRLEEFVERHGLKERPDLFIASDEEGRAWALYNDDPGNLPTGAPVGVIDKRDSRSFPFIERRFILARVQKIWWPLPRSRTVR